MNVSNIFRRADSLIVGWSAGGRRTLPVLRLTFAALFGATVLLTIAMTLFHERKHFVSEILEENTAITGLLRQREADHAAALKMALIGLSANTEMREAFVSRDRERLLALAMPAFLELRKRHDVTHFYFTDSQRMNFLRVHSPEQHSDRIDRDTTLKAEAEGTFAEGLELGGSGVFTLRVVTPWRDGQELIGFLELGMEIGHFLSQIETKANVRLIEAYDKEAIDDEAWKRADERQRESSLDLSPVYALAASRLEEIPASLIDRLDMLGPEAEPMFALTWSDGKLLHLSTVPLREAEGKQVGNLIIVRDATPEAVASIWAAMTIILPVIVFGLLALLVVNRIGRQLQNSALSAYDKLELKVQERTRALRDSLQRLDQARKVAGFGNWDWNIETNDLAWSDEIYSIFGLERGEFGASYDAFLERLHPDDREMVKDAVHNAVYDKQPYDIDHKIVLPDGQVRTVHEWGKVMFDAQGKPVRMIGIVQDITRRKALEEELTLHRDTLQKRVDEATADLKLKAQELEDALAREKELSELQRQFVSMASHEFRTPLAIIDQSAQRLKRKIDANELNPEAAIERLAKIRGAVLRMSRLMDSTLTAARLDEGKISFELQACDIATLVREVCDRQQEISDAHDIRCDVDELPEIICADATALDRIFTNLLSNAAKYSPDGGTIEVTGRTEGSEAVVSVQDHGLGIDRNELPKLFARFFRASTSLGIAGTGIGLHMVKTLAEMHGGSVAVDSRKGEGSTFTIRLPITGPEHTAGAEADAA